jgi:hypothetical protein
MNPNTPRGLPPCGHRDCPATQCRFSADTADQARINAYANAKIKLDQLLGPRGAPERDERGADARRCHPTREYLGR